MEAQVASPKLGRTAECGPGPPATTIWTSSGLSASGMVASGCSELNHFGRRRHTTPSRNSGGKSCAGRRAVSYRNRLTSDLENPPPARIAACSGQKRTRGPPPSWTFCAPTETQELAKVRRMPRADLLAMSSTFWVPVTEKAVTVLASRSKPRSTW
jgi:hypothetical protein